MRRLSFCTAVLGCGLTDSQWFEKLPSTYKNFPTPALDEKIVVYVVDVEYFGINVSNWNLAYVQISPMFISSLWDCKISRPSLSRMQSKFEFMLKSGLAD